MRGESEDMGAWLPTLKAAVCQVLDPNFPDGGAIGTGFAIAARQVLTCAHVLQSKGLAT